VVRIPDEVRNFYSSKAFEHKQLSYEERAKFYPAYRLNYCGLKTIYEQMGVPRETYKEDPSIFNLKKTCSTDTQV